MANESVPYPRYRPDVFILPPADDRKAIISFLESLTGTPDAEAIKAPAPMK